MDKDEILARSREENKDRDFVETEVLAKANSIALGVGGIMCGVLSVLHAIFADTLDVSIWTVYFGVLATVMLVKYVKLHRRHELAFGLFYLAFCIVFFAFYLYDLLGAK